MSPTVENIDAALDTVAQLLAQDVDYLPIFLRLEEELERAKNARPDPIARAKARAQRLQMTP